ncbi:MAG: sigma-E factor regulatory protein RseB domain-containing protein [Armatimonadota bacterium]
MTMIAVRAINCRALSLAVGMTAAVGVARAGPETDLGFAMLQQMAERERKVDFEGERTIVVYRGGRQWTTKQSVKQKDGVTKITVLFPPWRQRQVLRYGPHGAQNYLPWRRELRTQGPPDIAPVRTPAERIAALREGFDAKVADAVESVAERPVRIVSLIRKGSSRPARKLWIDQEKHVCLKSEWYRPNGELARTEFFTRIRFNPDIENGDLRPLQAPPDVDRKHIPGPHGRPAPLKRVQAQIPFTIVVPDPEGLPEGYKLLGDQTSIIRWQAEPVVWLRFSNGLDYLSLFERRARPGPLPGVGRGVGRLPFLVWQEGPIQFVLIGPVTLEQADLLKIRQHTHLPPPKAAQPRAPGH